MLHWLMATALLATSCVTQTPEEKAREERRQKRADTVAELANSAGTHFGLSPLQRAMLERKARKIAWSDDPLTAGIHEYDKHPELQKKAWEWLQGKNAGDVLGELGRQNPELEGKANEWLNQNPEAARRINELLGR